MEKRRFQTWTLVIIFGFTWLCSLSGILGTNGYVASNHDRTFTYNVQYGSYSYSHRRARNAFLLIHRFKIQTSRKAEV